MLSIIILAHGKSALTRQCLDALADVPEDVEVVLFDNASPDDTPAVAREFASRLRRFRYHQSKRNLSYALANNQAARSSAGGVLLFLNNDVIVSADAPRRLYQSVVEGGGGVAGAKLTYPDRSTIQHAGMRQMLWGYASNLGTGAGVDHPALNRTGDIFAVTGAMLAISRAVFDRIGGFDERYWYGYEDVDLCLKARVAGAPVRYVAEAESVHAESATLAAVRAPAHLRANYRLYRQRWNRVLVPNERTAIRRLQDQGISRVVVFGTGLAAAGLSRILTRHGIQIAAFTASVVDCDRYCGRPVLPLDQLRSSAFDRLLVGSQHFFALREQLAPFDPAGAPLFPVADGDFTELG